ncbi:MAG: hypothetical protein A2X11_06135 [Bacteroidetes bacterium GWE2_42_24]|nr:MAG: hypothetical protein A2X11_06135 [Bacteroidetes bacterium GWE2_42_24]OFY31369.1 MAG: hypothetical protein A2X09_01215 [Bacteroidetes bacterium GWF2_43_11]
MIFVGEWLPAQTNPERFVAFLKDKNNNPYSISNPSAFLSERALARRARYSIAIDAYDLPVTPDYITQVRGTGAEVINTSRWLNTITFATSDPIVLDVVRALSFVDSVSAVFPKKSASIQPGSGVQATPGIPPYSIQRIDGAVPVAPLKSGNVLDYGLAANQTTMVNLQELHNAGYTGDGMLIAVLDAGFANANQISVFDTLWLTNRIMGWRDISEPGNDIFASTMHSHGTSVLSLMGGNMPGQLVGTAPHATYFLIRTEEGPTESLVEEYNWAAGAELADSIGADVINSSLGYTTFDNPLFNHSYSDLDGKTTPVSIAAGRAASRGMLVVNSAGNEGGGSWQYVGAPADGPQVFTIGAVDFSGQYANFSSTGPTFDGRIKPDITAQGSGAAVAFATGDIGFGSGTSFSSPLIAGAMACLWQTSPSHSPGEVKDAVRFTASKADNPDNYYGYGIPDFLQAQLSIGLGETTVENPSLRLAPNPFVSFPSVLISGAPDQPFYISVFDMNGSCVFRSGKVVLFGNGVFSVREFNQLPSGIYMVLVEGSGTRQFVKAVKL